MCIRLTLRKYCDRKDSISLKHMWNPQHLNRSLLLINRYSLDSKCWYCCLYYWKSKLAFKQSNWRRNIYRSWYFCYRWIPYAFRPKQRILNWVHHFKAQNSSNFEQKNPNIEKVLNHWDERNSWQLWIALSLAWLQNLYH